MLFFFEGEEGIRDDLVTGVQTCALPIYRADGRIVVIPFDWAEPITLKEAVGLLDPDDATVRPIAGGTALMLMMKAGVFRPRRLVSLRKLAARYSRVVAGEGGGGPHRGPNPPARGRRPAPAGRGAPPIPP